MPYAGQFGGPPQGQFGGPPQGQFGGPPQGQFGGPPQGQFGGGQGQFGQLPVLAMFYTYMPSLVIKQACTLLSFCCLLKNLTICHSADAYTFYLTFLHYRSLCYRSLYYRSCAPSHSMHPHSVFRLTALLILTVQTPMGASQLF